MARKLAARLLVLLCGAAAVGLGVASAASPPVRVGSHAATARGAPVAFDELEAEQGRTNGSIIGPSRAFGTLAAEASGRQAVRLPVAGSYVELTLRAPANAIDVRYSLPDSATGTGTTSSIAVQIAGKVVADLPLTSAYSWFYGVYPFKNDPKEGGAHHFYDDARTLLGSTFPRGTKVR